MAPSSCERGSDPVVAIHFPSPPPTFSALHFSRDLALLCFGRPCLSCPTYGVVFCVDVFAIYTHGVTYQAHFVVYIFLFFHSVIMVSTCILFAVSTSCRSGTRWTSSPQAHREPTQVDLVYTSRLSPMKGGGLLFQQVHVQAIGHLPGWLHRTCSCSPELWRIDIRPEASGFFSAPGVIQFPKSWQA